MKTLDIEIIGTGEMSGFKFKQIKKSDFAYLYEVKKDYVVYHYEVFERKSVQVCLNFEKRIYSETEKKEIYPKAKDFGEWAFCFTNYDNAFIKFEYITFVCNKNSIQNVIVV